MIRAAVCALALCLTAPTARAADGPRELATRANQILQNNCAVCHRGPSARGAVDMLNHSALLRTRVVVPGKPDESELIQLARAGTMPPGERRKLSREDIEALTDWVAGGAPAPPFPYGDA